ASVAEESRSLAPRVTSSELAARGASRLLSRTNPMQPTLTRRGFVQGGTAALLTAASYQRVLGANDRVGVGFIGYGLIGKRHVLDFQAQADVDCVGICDAHSGRLEEGRAQLGGAARACADFRELLNDHHVDAVVVSTP